ncbi:hypothetical protein RFI_39140 [Reticulomyxa filosa]|uniref:Uncharacterized protein n=1 Tax=Reticulomyxa filosa TaxID=46433 RepID=X6LAM0_RETFI|nr:hypothetical protein RFI_39140 [Reticulomyxa filosa]|eukprot:ETN98370.1 hypothetical protein RFI_39140 [Reticulomyxa filosa]
MDSSLVYENILTTLQILVVVPVVSSAKYVTRDSSKENVQIHSNNHDNMGTTTISLNMFVSYSLRQTRKSKMWKYVPSPQFCNNVKRVSLAQLKNSRIRILKSTLMIDPTQSNESVNTKTPAMNIFMSTSRISATSYILIFKSKYSDLEISEYITILLMKNKVEDNCLGADVGLCKNSKSQSVLIVTPYVGNVELLRLYVSLEATFSIHATVSIRQWCAYHRHTSSSILRSPMHKSIYNIILQMIFDIAILYHMAKFKLNMDGRGRIDKWTGQLRLLATKSQSSLHCLAPALMAIEALFAQIRMCKNTTDKQSNCESVVIAILFCTSELLLQGMVYKCTYATNNTIAFQQLLQSTHDPAPAPTLIYTAQIVIGITMLWSFDDNIQNFHCTIHIKM